MPDWLAPFHRPRMHTEEFLKTRDKYVKKHGYSYTIPGFDQVVHLKYEHDISLKEEKIWKRKAYSELAPGRYEEIKYMKNERKLRYMDMLGSPQPQIFQNRGALLGSIDDCQDAISTIVCLVSIVIKYVPAAMGKLLMGPLGWLMSAGQVMNLATEFLVPEQRLVAQKRMHDKITEDNPFSKKAMLKNAEKIKKGGFHQGNIIEGLQVTKDIFGIGLNIGALMNVPLDIITGAARAALGQKVTVNYPVPNWDIWIKRLIKAGKAMLYSMGMPRNPDDHNYAQMLLLFNMLGRVLTPEFVGYDPLDGIREAAHVPVPPPRPTHFLTREVIQEIDPGGFEPASWPGTEEKHSTLNDIMITTSDTISQNYQDYCYDNQRNWKGYVSATAASQAVLLALENAEGPGSVQYDYTASCKITHTLLDQNLHFPQDLAPWQKARMLVWLEAHDAAGTCPTLPEVISYAKAVCGFEFFVGTYPSTIRFKALGVPKALTYSGIFDEPKTERYPTVPTHFAEIWQAQARSPK